MPRQRARYIKVTTYRRGKSWYAQFSKDGKRVQRALGTRDEREAEELAKHLALELNEGSLYGRRIAEIRGEIPESSTPSLAAYSAEYLKRRALRHPASQARTEQTVRDHLLPRFGKHPLDEISYAAVEDWCTERLNTEGVAHLNVQRELAVLKAVLNDAVKRGVIATHQARYTLPKNREAEVIRVLSPDQIRTVFDASNPEHRAIWQLMVNTGLRRGEAMEAKHADIHPMNGSGHQLVLGRSITKSAKTRRVPLNDKALEAIETLRNMGSTEYLLPRMSLHALGKAFKRDTTRAGIPEASLHWLRHSCASIAANSGVPLQNVQAVLGHADISTTMKYVHPSDDLAAVTAAVNIG